MDINTALDPEHWFLIIKINYTTYFILQPFKAVNLIFCGSDEFD